MGTTHLFSSVCKEEYNYRTNLIFYVFNFQEKKISYELQSTFAKTSLLYTNLSSMDINFYFRGFVNFSLEHISMIKSSLCFAF